MGRILFLCLTLSAGTAIYAAEVTFRDVAAEAGISFVHDMGAAGERMMVETMGSGGGFVDFDNDGDLDIYLLNGAPMPGYQAKSGAGPLKNALYRNDGPPLAFTDVTEASGTGDTGYGMGICAGDYDNDGFVDFYVTNFGANVMFHNTGGGAFSDETAASGTGDAHWGSSCAFLDSDRDGDLDLYVTNYVDFTTSNNKFCGDYPNSVKAYCHPNVYESEPDVLYRNNGDGTFTDASDEAGITARRGNGLGVVTGDVDNDGDVDIYVANDKSPNILYLGDGKGSFTDSTLGAGVGYSTSGVPQAGMGTDLGDYDHDGDLDLVVTNLDFEYNALYRNEGHAVFSDNSFAAGIGAVSLSYVGFGSDFFDFNNDGLLDLAIANGHILDNATYFNDATTYAQRPFLFRGDGTGKLVEIGRTAGPGFADEIVARGLSSGDVDNDGDIDLLMTVSGGPPRLLLNDSAGSGSAGSGSGNRMIGVRLVGTGSNRSAIGARASYKVKDMPSIREIQSGGSYQSQPDLRLHFGLGTGTSAEITVRWPSGETGVYSIKTTNRYVTIIEGRGVSK